LQLEVEGDAEAFAEGEPPGAVDPGAEGGVDDELLAAAFVEEALEDDVLLRGDDAHHLLLDLDVLDDLVCSILGEAAFGHGPVDRGLCVAARPSRRSVRLWRTPLLRMSGKQSFGDLDSQV
jgi:hypothetical protein